MNLIQNFWLLLGEAAPWLLFGFFIAGILHAFLPPDLLGRHLGKESIGTTVKAAFIGAPLPLCSCGVIPAALGLRRSGASKSATVSFLVATPETGVDSVSVSYAMLGPVMAIVRPFAAISSAIVAGILVGTDKAKTTNPMQSASSSCCQQKEPAETASCCGTNASSIGKSFSQKCKEAFTFSTGKLIADTAVWLLVGLFFASLVKTFVSQDFLASYGQGILAMSVMVLVSIPMYICATASTPIAAGLMFAGVSPGAVLVFMLAGPATNIATLGVVGSELGKRPLVAYLIGVVCTAMLFGAAFDLGLQYFEYDIMQSIAHHQHLMPDSVSLIASMVLIVLLIRALFSELRERYFVHSPSEIVK